MVECTGSRGGRTRVVVVVVPLAEKKGIAVGGAACVLRRNVFIHGYASCNVGVLHGRMTFVQKTEKNRLRTWKRKTSFGCSSMPGTRSKG